MNNEYYIEHESEVQARVDQTLQFECAIVNHEWRQLMKISNIL